MQNYVQKGQTLTVVAPYALLSGGGCQVGNIFGVTVNGKKRGELTVGRDAGNPAIEKSALALDAVVRAMDNKPVRKVIIVPNRIVNVVV